MAIYHDDGTGGARDGHGRYSAVDALSDDAWRYGYGSSDGCRHHPVILFCAIDHKTCIIILAPPVLRAA